MEKALQLNCPLRAIANEANEEVCGMDSNRDGIIGVDDLLALLALYGRSTPQCADAGR